jgi:hypothetical protein
LKEVLYNGIIVHWDWKGRVRVGVQVHVGVLLEEVLDP